MKKAGIFGLLAGGAALVGAGIFSLLKKPNEVGEADVFADDEIEVEVDDYETEKYTTGRISEFKNEPECQAFCHARFDQHRGQHKRKDVEPHDGMSQLRKGLLLCGDLRQDQSQDNKQCRQVVRDGLGNPQHDGGQEDGKHRIVGAGEILHTTRLDELHRLLDTLVGGGLHGDGRAVGLLHHHLGRYKIALR